MIFVGNLVLFQAVKEYENPLRIDTVIATTYEFGVLLFWDAVYISFHQKGCRVTHQNLVTSLSGRVGENIMLMGQWVLKTVCRNVKPC